MPDGFSALVVPVVSWVAVRSEPWREPASGPEILSSGLRLVRPPPMLGVMCLMFAVGPGTSNWSERLGQSDWYAAMRPRPADLGQQGPSQGCCPIGDLSLNGTGLPSGADEVASLFPEIRLVTVALLDRATPAELDAAFHLVRALGSRRVDGNRRLRVVVTVDGAEAKRTTAVPLFKQLGATVIRGAEGMDADHLHHFPVRAMLRPPSGRLVCVDLADCLMCWPPGRAGVLHLIPFNVDRAARALCDIPMRGRLITVTLIAHFPEHGPDSTLVAMDGLARLCGTVLFGSFDEAPMLFTTGDRLDGVTGTADLLLIHDG